ncbi:hypothetical protein G7074_07910 [Pedobacter sp. HDW13]|uniref:WxcM-like domain-containing protein n=1 Tax=Pedobacter sp. HDW13 TaxID=2714940 RepID=UPI00140C9CBE|nr:WxcM-like domain-containing protein [Pedobacter sp. HDW13]QIL42568.1 hypothetical protein G7074_07910 [Pedobacter sp. HDW13]
MSEVCRFYTIEHPFTAVERGWRGHQIEQRWFFASEGSFTVKIVKINDWTTPDPKLPQVEFLLSDQQPDILHVPKGYATLLKANEINSKLLIFADRKIEEASLDNYLYDTTYFNS